MSFDALTLTAVCDELQPLLQDTRVQKLVFVDDLSIAIEAFSPSRGRTNVLLSADLDDARVQRIDRLPARGLERDTPFSLIARKHLRNVHIRSVRQPRLERVFEVDCEQRDASGQHYRLLLIVEAMGRRSNLVLVDQNGVILDAARRTPPSRNARRPILPHLPYEPPPPQTRLFPEDITAEALAMRAAEAKGSLARLLSDNLAGLSPLAGRELAFRATGDAQTDLLTVDWTRVAAATRDFLAQTETHAWQPTLAFEDGHAVDYAPFELTHLVAAGGSLEHFASISAAIEAYHTRLAEAGPARRGDPLAAERKALLAPLDKAMDSTARRIAALEYQLENGQAQRQPLRHAGELILTHQADLPPGATELVVDGERFELDPFLSAIDNAQTYFARYRKAREAEQRVPELLEAARLTGAHLADLRTLVEVADGMDSVRALRREVGAATSAAARDRPDPPKAKGSRARGSPGSAKAPYRRVALGGGWEALIGASATGNAAVTFDLGQPDDLWLHARGIPGAHVIVHGNAAAPPNDIVERAAELAAWHSASRAAGAVEVDIAPRRHVKKIPNGPPGLVRYANERTVRVTPKA
ncbi:MAG TPA: NFACT family protein [Chloroflexota bacterium]|nr:NFACT family protein [Chloroflexota bacterium]